MVVIVIKIIMVISIGSYWVFIMFLYFVLEILFYWVGLVSYLFLFLFNREGN